MKTIYKGSESIDIHHAIDLEGWLKEGWEVTPPSKPIETPKDAPKIKRKRKAKVVDPDNDK